MKNKIIFGIIAIVLLFSIFYAIDKLTEPELDSYFEDNPKEWVEIQEDQAEINIFKATNGNSIVLENQQDYNIDGRLISFFYRGGYQGVSFKTHYLDDKFYIESIDKSLEEQEQLANKYLLMKIGPELNPTDNIINGFILGKQENKQFVFYIFVDEDWKQKLDYTNILWGDDFTNSRTLNLKKFTFTKVKEGIYMDKVFSDVDWFNQNPVSGGIAVGEIDKQIISDIISDIQVNSTFMYIR